MPVKKKKEKKLAVVLKGGLKTAVLCGILVCRESLDSLALLCLIEKNSAFYVCMMYAPRVYEVLWLLMVVGREDVSTHIIVFILFHSESEG